MESASGGAQPCCQTAQFRAFCIQDARARTQQRAAFMLHTVKKKKKLFHQGAKIPIYGMNVLRTGCAQNTYVFVYGILF